MHERPRKPYERKLWRLAPIAVSVTGHAVALLVLLAARTDGQMMVEPPSVAVSIIQEQPEPPPPPPPPPPEEPSTPRGPPKKDTTAAAARSVQAKTPAPAPRSMLRPTPVPKAVEPLPASPRPTRAPTITVGEGLLASAGTADGPGGTGTGQGGGGAGCNMVKLLQTALRKNNRVRAAVIDAHSEAVASGKAIMVWNGSWIRAGVQDGKGLAAVRQAISLEVAFAPEACRAEPVRGLVLLKLAETPNVRLVLGQNSWRWSDLLFAS